MKPLISSVRVRLSGIHDHVTVWNRGACAGELTVPKGEGEMIARRLLNVDEREPFEEHTGSVTWVLDGTDLLGTIRL